MRKTSTIYLLTTGGTLEKAYSEQTGSVHNFNNKVERYLSRLRIPNHDVIVVPLMNKDSLEMSDDDRAVLLTKVRELLVEGAPIVISHGTDTMVESGLYLKRSLPDVSVTVVLTGAMTPLGFEDSDGLQNLTESLIAAQLLCSGIYIVMHNSVYPIDRVRKDRALSRFVWNEESAQPNNKERL